MVKDKIYELEFMATENFANVHKARIDAAKKEEEMVAKRKELAEKMLNKCWNKCTTQYPVTLFGIFQDIARMNCQKACEEEYQP